MRRPALVLLVLVLLATLPAPPADAEAPFHPTSVSTATGSTVGGVENVRATDGLSAATTEAATGPLDELALLVPTSDVTAQWNALNGVGLCVPAGDWCSQAQVNEPDSATSFISSAEGLTWDDEFHVSDWSGPTDITIDSVTMFTWAKNNGTYTNSYSPRLKVGAFSCSAIVPVLTTSFANYTSTYATSCETALTWAVAELDDVRLFHRDSPTTGPGDRTDAVTWGGAVVQYDDPDYDAATTFTWTGIDDPRATTLRIAASTSGETFTAQAQDCASGSWVSLTAVANTAIALVTVDVAGRICGSTFTLRFIGATPTSDDDTTADVLTVDELTLERPGGDGEETPIIQARVACTVEGDRVVCRAFEYTTSPVESRTWRFSPRVRNLAVWWTVFGWQEAGSLLALTCFGLPFLDPGDCQAVSFEAPPWWTFNVHEFEVEYTANAFTRSATDREIVVVDHRPLGLVLLGAGILVVGGLLARRMKEPKAKRPAGGPPEIETKEE